MRDVRFFQIDKLWYEETPHEPHPSWLTRQQAIPWCIPHNMKGNEVGFCPLLGVQNDAPCEVSFGGPDHKWWEDHE